MPSGRDTNPTSAGRSGFVSDCLASGSVIRALTVADDYTHECAAIEVQTSPLGQR
jgi:hypothetical protein